jgi:hypothetical protein
VPDPRQLPGLHVLRHGRVRHGHVVAVVEAHPAGRGEPQLGADAGGIVRRPRLDGEDGADQGPLGVLDAEVDDVHQDGARLVVVERLPGLGLRDHGVLVGVDGVAGDVARDRPADVLDEGDGGRRGDVAAGRRPGGISGISAGAARIAHRG